ncbi:hypothetical protein HIM_12611 [Hirsutella minnesotensis 3608]|uniref:Uncharacterized protein n=1 Tax=Hirsutella minnesotensis 3608 TaxID=1043627 RepID=A0A0F7ZZW5_9HYPO|nr:hypothetical protein HIM_12611 [Hirsutella minnesotensis 3608]
MIRDGLVNITKIEFLSCIQRVRLQAFKPETIRSAFRKTGIWPINPQTVLEVLQARQMHRTPSPPLGSGPSSSPFETPLTLRQMNKVADLLETSLREDDGLTFDLRRDLGRFIRGSLSLATELVQTKRDLGRTKMAERVRQQRRSFKNAQIKSGGVLTVAQGREMVRKRDEEEVRRARRVVEAAEMKARSMRRKCFEDAAKKARQWRSSGKLSRAEVCDSERGTWWLKRF